LAARLGGALVYAGAGLLLLVVLAVATAGPVYAVLGCLVAAGLTGIVVLGAERAAVVTMILAFATAPMYRGLEGLSGGVGTPTDFFLVMSVMLLLPGLLARRLEIPAVYIAGLVIIAVCGLISSALSTSPLFSLFPLVQWLFFLGGLPIVIAWWRPGTKIVVTLLWAYVFGQMASTAYALATGPVVGNRYQGLSHHTNAFGMAGMTAIAILLYLYAHHRGVHARVIVLGAGGISAISIIMSGSRAAVVVAAVLVLLIPFVERSAVSGFVLSILGALALVAFPLLVQSGHAGSALTRLAGDSTAVVADQARTSALDYGLQKFWERPVVGSGMADVEVIHDVFLEVAVGIGIIGLAGFLICLVVLCRPLLTLHVHRRLSYLPLAYIGMGPALPSIYDRTMWVPIALSMLAVIKAPDAAEADAAAPVRVIGSRSLAPRTSPGPATA
jgi:hypothetical protein